MKKLLLIACLILFQLISFCQTPGVNVKSEKVGINITNPSRQFEIQGLDNTVDNVFYSRTNYIGDEDVIAIEGWSVPAIGFGFGGYFTGGYRGLYAHGDGDTYSGTVYGVQAHASGEGGTRVGLKATAYGGTTNWSAELGPGNVRVVDNLSVGTSANTARVQITNINNVIGSSAIGARILASHNGFQNSYGTLITSEGTGSGNVFGIHNTASSTHPSATVFGIYTNTPVSDGWAMYVSGKSYISDGLRIGTQVDPYSGQYKLILDGKMIAEEVRIQSSGAWPDYVFASDYQLMNLKELEQSINQNHHLPGVPSALIVESEGIAVGEMQKIMMEKIEELTLYIIQQQKEIDQLKNQVNQK